MEHFDRYIRILRLFLPKDQREDIIRELSEEFESQVTRKEQERGRPLTSEEEAGLIGQYGHPLLLAARYQPQRYLVGPAVFPFYWLALKVTVALFVAGHLVAGLVLFASDAPFPPLGQALAEVAGDLLKILGWFTVLGVLWDRLLAKMLLHKPWIPGDLPQPIQHAMGVVEQGHQIARDAASLAGHRHTASMPPRGVLSSSEPSVARVVVAVVLSVWWLLALKFPALVFGSGANVLDWAPIVDRVYPVLVLVQLVMLAAPLITLTGFPDGRFMRVTRYVGIAGALLFLYFVFTVSHEWVVWTGPEEARSRYNVIAQIAGRNLSLVDVINYSISGVLIVVAMGCVFGLLSGSRNQFTGPSRRKSGDSPISMTSV